MCYAEFIEALFEGRIETTVRCGGGVAPVLWADVAAAPYGDDIRAG